MTFDELLALEVPQDVCGWAVRRLEVPPHTHVLRAYDMPHSKNIRSTEVFDVMYLLTDHDAEIIIDSTDNSLHLSLAELDHELPVDYASCEGFDELVALLRTMIRLHWDEDYLPPLIEEYERDSR